MTWPKSPFWDYSLVLYRRPGVEAACLGLQRRHGLDVNMVLFACWLADRGIELDQMTLERAKNAVSSWHVEVVRPLRALRRRLGARIGQAEPDNIAALWPEHADHLRRDVLAVELDGEHLAQLALARLSENLQPGDRGGPDLAGFNLARYWRFRSNDRRDLRTLLHQAFPEAAAEDLAGALRSMGTP